VLKVPLNHNQSIDLTQCSGHVSGYCTAPNWLAKLVWWIFAQKIIQLSHDIFLHKNDAGGRIADSYYSEMMSELYCDIL